MDKLEAALKNKKTILYIEDLNYRNYKDYINQIISSVEIIMQDSNTNMSQLSALVGISRYTLRKIFSGKGTLNLKYNTVNKLNKFVSDVMSGVPESGALESGAELESIEPIVITRDDNSVDETIN